MNVTIPDPALWGKVYTETEKILSDSPACHDFAHTLRVLHNAERIAAAEKPEHLDAVRFGALLHDIARPEELATHGKVCHAALGAEKSEEILRRCGCTDEILLRLVPEMVRSHRYRGGVKPATLEAEILYDADKLDSLGVYGIARAFHFAGRIGACLHNSMEDALHSDSYSKEDSAYREYLVKLRHLPEKMLTVTGKELAKERAAYMNDFFDRMNREA